MTDTGDHPGLSEGELIKARSRYLRGTIAEELHDPTTGSISETDNVLLKFHGSYQQDNRDLRLERQTQKLEPAYQFMVRVRLPGGVCTPRQWLSLDALASTYADGTLRLTSRQTFQFHGILKHELKRTIAAINDAMLTTLATCGDVNRNVMCNPNPEHSRIHRQVYDISARLSEHLLPKTRAYHEIWLGDDKVAQSPAADTEPLYGDRYLPRKFKITVAVPPANDVDVFAHDLGYIAIVENDTLAGFNITVGGGMGMTHGDTTTFPRLADPLGFCRPDQVIEVAEAVIALQRDEGNRQNRRNARFKYTVERLGLDTVRHAVEQRLGWSLEPSRPFSFNHNGDRFGWHQDNDGSHSVTLHVPAGRIADTADCALMTALRQVAEVHAGDFRLTPNQNIMICGISAATRDRIAAILSRHGVDDCTPPSGLRRNAMACVAFPTCGLAMAESERFLPRLLSQLEQVLESFGLGSQDIQLRVTGCPNGCVRPYLAEIGLVGKAPDRYNLFLGGSRQGTRCNRLYRESVSSEGLLELLTKLFEHYAAERMANEALGDFVIRTQYVSMPASGPAFHAPPAADSRT